MLEQSGCSHARTPLVRRCAAFTLAAVLFGALAAEAGVSRMCDVSYQMSSGVWTTPIRREVTFQTGRELNKNSTNYFSYGAYDEYALIVLNSGDPVSIVEIDAALSTRFDVFTNEDFRRLFTVGSEVQADEVNNQKGRKWRIVAKVGVPPRFIDQRAEREPAIDAAASPLARHAASYVCRRVLTNASGAGSVIALHSRLWTNRYGDGQGSWQWCARLDCAPP